MAKNWPTEVIEILDFFLSLVIGSADGFQFPVLRQAFSVNCNYYCDTYTLQMTSLLKEISENAINYEDFEFTSEQKNLKWLGNIPATEKQISDSEIRLGVKLPQDYKDFLLITNGFFAPNDIEPNFENVENIDYLKNVDNFTIEAYDITELKDSIVIGGLNDEQYFLLIPPTPTSNNWKYWKFANWIPGKDASENLKQYFENVLTFQNEQYQK